MHTTIQTAGDGSSHQGLRLSAEEYFELEDEGFRYELIDGVLCMSPSPTPKHQGVALGIAGQIWTYLQRNPVGKVFAELDVHLGKGPRGADLVYRPDVVFIRADRAAKTPDRLVGPPDLVVEVASGTSRLFDSRTKKDDYQRCGVPEYWMIDPDAGTMTFYRLREGRYVEVKPEGDRVASESITGFTLDLARLRQAFE